MRRLLQLSVLMFLITATHYSQAPERAQGSRDAAQQKLWLTSELQSLDAESQKLGEPLARASAKTEIAAAAWTLDQAWAEKLLREAYALTLPDEAAQAKLHAAQIGAPPALPTPVERAGNDIRSRVLAIAARDKIFADELAGLGAKQLGREGSQLSYANLASQAIKAGETQAAARYISQAIEVDPTLLNAGFSILDLAAKDRAAADALLIQYIERLRAVPLSLTDQSAFRVYAHLENLIFPSPRLAAERGRILPAGAAAMRAYVGFMIESMSRLESTAPGSARIFRHFLLSTWLPLNQYAPDLVGAFLELEKLSRRPGEDTSLPTRENVEEAAADKYERQVRDALKSNQPDEFLINSVISRGDFDKARKLIDKLPEGARKSQLLEAVDAKEALALSAKGDAAGAEQLAERLHNASFILQVYPPLLKACAASKDQACPARLVYQAVRQLKRADATPPAPPAGIPASALATSRELDPVLLSLSQLAAQVAPVSDALALELLDEIVEAANRSDVDTGQGRTGFDASVFKLLAASDEARARQAAEGFKDRLRRIVALSSIYQVKADALSRNRKPGV